MATITQKHANPADAERASAPGRAVVKVTPNDNADLPDGICNAIACGTAGTCTFTDANGNLCTNFPLQQGYNPIGATRIRATGTLASDIWAIY